MEEITDDRWITRQERWGLQASAVVVRNRRQPRFINLPTGAGPFGRQVR
jgi:hypothetical protein